MTTDPKCRVCQSAIAVWHEDAPEQAICMDCCEHAEHPDGERGHQYEYERGEREHWCRYCASPAPTDWYAE